MKKKIHSFYKMQASGNDFIVMDNRKGAVRDAARAARELCDRHFGVGADGLLLIESSRKADFKMRIVNADGSEAEMCGNGSRCIGLFAREVLKFPKKFLIETLAGVIGADVSGKTVKVKLTDPKDFRQESELEAAGRKFRYYFVNTGVPHAVIFLDDLREFPVDEFGPVIRHHKAFGPAGTNVNFVEVTGRNSISVRTFERGVGETQACGTGVSASAVVSFLAEGVKPPVKVKTRGGETITIHFELGPEKVKVINVYLEGQAHFVYKGEVLPDSK